MIHSKELLIRINRTLVEVFFKCYNGAGMPLEKAAMWADKLTEDSGEQYYIKHLQKDLYEPTKQVL